MEDRLEANWGSIEARKPWEKWPKNGAVFSGKKWKFDLLNMAVLLGNWRFQWENQREIWVSEIDNFW